MYLYVSTGVYTKRVSVGEKEIKGVCACEKVTERERERVRERRREREEERERVREREWVR